MINQRLRKAKLLRKRKKNTDFKHKKKVLMVEYKRIIKGRKKMGFSMKFPTPIKHRISKKKSDEKSDKKINRGERYAEKKIKEAKKTKVSG